LARQIEASQLMAAQRHVAVAPLHIGTRALEHEGEPLGLVMELALRFRAQRAQGSTGFKQRDAKPLSKLAQRCAIAAGARLGHAIEIGRGNQLGVHDEGDGWRQVELSDLLPHITRDDLDGRLHFGHHPLGFLDAFHAALAESFVLGTRTNLLDVSADIRGNELAVATYSALEIDHVVVVANAPDTRLDLCTLRSEARVLSLLPTHGCLWGTPWTVLCGLVTRALRVALQ